MDSSSKGVDDSLGRPEREREGEVKTETDQSRRESRRALGSQHSRDSDSSSSLVSNTLMRRTVHPKSGFARKRAMREEERRRRTNQDSLSVGDHDEIDLSLISLLVEEMSLEILLESIPMRVGEEDTSLRSSEDMRVVADRVGLGRRLESRWKRGKNGQLSRLTVG